MVCSLIVCIHCLHSLVLLVVGSEHTTLLDSDHERLQTEHKSHWYGLLARGDCLPELTQAPCSQLQTPLAAFYSENTHCECVCMCVCLCKRDFLLHNICLQPFNNIPIHKRVVSPHPVYGLTPLMVPHIQA